MDECAVGADNCDILAEYCVNTPGAFTCVDRPGGPPVIQRPGNFSLIHAIASIESNFTYQETSANERACPAGFKFNAASRVCDGKNLKKKFNKNTLKKLFKDIDECASPTPVCPSQMTCHNAIGSFTCVRKTIEECPAGFRFNAQIDTCSGKFKNLKPELVER